MGRYVAVKDDKPDEPPMKNGERYIGSYWTVVGCGWSGRWTKRDGKIIKCGHKHKTEDTAIKCRDQMRKNRPGKCQDYRTAQIFVTAIKRSR